MIRPQPDEHSDYRGYAGTIASGVLRVNDPVVALPSGLTSTIAAIDTLHGEVTEASRGVAIMLRLADDIDISRGTMLARPANQPIVGQDLDAMVTDITYRLDVTSTHRDDSATELVSNDLGRIRLRSTTPLAYDPYRRNRSTGGFVLIDETTNATVAAGMLLEPRGS